LIAHAARTRDLVAGTIIGSGTISTKDYAARGTACIFERRAIEIIAGGKPETPFMALGDRVRIVAVTSQGRTPFGAIDQTINRA
jgi:fumarylacetoacetate (FAA) hydrolase